MPNCEENDYQGQDTYIHEFYKGIIVRAENDLSFEANQKGEVLMSSANFTTELKKEGEKE